MSYERRGRRPTAHSPHLSATMPITRSLIIFARAPELGRVKTRLAADLGDEAALGAYRMLGARVVAALASIERCATTVAYTPGDAASERATRDWLGAAWDDAGAGGAAGPLAFAAQCD